jgi:MFS family permease
MKSFMRELLNARLSPFRNRDFRNFFIAQTLSMVGTWSHDLARSWIIVEATGSSGALGNLNLAISIPCLFLILQGGVLVDRSDVRHLIRRTKSLMAISALVLAGLSEFSHLQIWQLLIFGLIEGVLVSFDSPAFQALTVRMVPRKEFQQAIALNSTNFHTSRMLGPIVAAWLMAMHGPSLVFLFDGLTYFVVAIVLGRVHLQNVPRPHQQGRGPSLMEGLKYIADHAQLRYRVLQLLLTIACVYPLMVAVFRVYVQQKFHLNARQFGEAFSFPALGSMAGALTFAVLKPREPVRALVLGVPLVFAMLVLIPWLPALEMTVAAMSFAGFGLYLCYSSLTVSMQLEVEEAFRGRMSGVIGFGFSALGPLMCFPWGHLADAIGAPQAIVISAVLFGAGSVALSMAHQRRLKKAFT